MEFNYLKWIELVNKQTDDAFQTIGILVRAKIELLCNAGKFEEAKEIENAYDVINKHFDNKLDFKAGDKKC